MLRVVYYSFLCQLLRALLLSRCIRGIIVLRVLVSVLASYIRTLGYLLGYPPSKANLLVLLFLFLKVLLLYFLSLLGPLGALRYLPPIALPMLRLGFLLPKSTSIPLTPICLSSVGLTSIILRQMVFQYSFILYFGSFLSLTVVFTGLLHVSLPSLYGPGPQRRTILLLLFLPVFLIYLPYFGVVGFFFYRAPQGPSIVYLGVS